jgi:hypothetical protein
MADDPTGEDAPSLTKATEIIERQIPKHHRDAGMTALLDGKDGRYYLVRLKWQGFVLPMRISEDDVMDGDDGNLPALLRSAGSTLATKVRAKRSQREP